MHPKLLSHRTRSFDKYEHTKDGMINACKSGILYIEIDIRLSKDNVFFVYHNPTLRIDNRVKKFCDISSEEIDAFNKTSSYQIMTLTAAIELFSQYSVKEQTLCLDIKDYGQEEMLADLVRDSGIQSQVAYVSWIPQTLLKLHSIDAGARLILSHWNMHKFSLAGRLFSSAFAGCMFSMGNFVFIGSAKYKSELQKFSLGYQHALFCTTLPPELKEVLSASGGGICIQANTVSKSIIRYCKKHNIQLWVFSASTLEEYHRLDNIDGIDVIFADNASDIILNL